VSLGVLAAVVVVAVLVAPVVLRGGSSPRCSSSLRFAGRTYVPRAAPSREAVQAAAIGVGVVSGCGARPSNVDVRSLVGVRPTAAVGVDGQASSVFVRPDLCPTVATASLVGCLRSKIDVRG
jgi:hypothetical protein